MLTRSTPVTGTLLDNSRTLLRDFRATPSVQAFYIDATRLTMLISKAGIRFTFAPLSFQTLSGETVYGEVQILLEEVFHKEDIILSNRLTTSEDRLLETGGQFSIHAFQEGVPLQLAIPIGVEMPILPRFSHTLSMRLFVGSLSSTLTSVAGKVFDWKMVVDKYLKVNKISKKKYFYFYITELNWFACSTFYAKRTPRTMVSARCSSPIEDLDELAAYLVFNELNSVTRMYPNGNRFTGVNIPANQAASIIMIGCRQGEWFYGSHKMDKTSSQQVTVKLEPVIETQLLEYLHRL
ncbi:MAG: hypothetical protein ACK4TA_03800 [Saprospiraceae bacterium]